MSSAERKLSKWDTRTMCTDRRFYRHFMDSLCRLRNKLMYILSWRTVSALTQVLCWCLFPSLLCNSGNKHQNNTHERWNSLSLEYIHYSIFSGCFWKVICTKFCHNISVIIWNITNKFSIELKNWCASGLLQTLTNAPSLCVLSTVWIRWAVTIVPVVRDTSWMAMELHVIVSTALRGYKTFIGNGLIPGSTKPLPESILNHHQYGPVTFIRGQFQNTSAIIH